MIEDAYENINFVGETVVVDAFKAWVCKKKCGYYEKIIENEGEENLDFKQY